MHIKFRTSNVIVDFASEGEIPWVIVVRKPRASRGVCEEEQYLELHQIAEKRCPEIWADMMRRSHDLDEKTLLPDSEAMNEEIRTRLYQYADILKNHAGDVLYGDFSDFDTLPKKMMKRKGGG